MKSLKTTINTPSGPRVIPDWAACHCVSKHRPHYIHPYPFALPNGDELWLCPNTYHQTTTLLGLYKSLDGPPAGRTLAKFNYFVRSLITLYWQQVLEEQADAQAFEAWKNSLKDEDDMDLFEDIKRVVADE